VLEELRGFDAILLGAVGSPDVAPGVLERGLLLRLRFELDLYINLRPFQAPVSVGAGVPVDFAVVRENTEGSYAGEGGWLRKGTAAEVATQGSVNTRFGVERCTRFRLRAGRLQASPPHPRPQDQRPHLLRGPLATGVQRGGGRSTRGSRPPTTTSMRRAFIWLSPLSATT